MINWKQNISRINDLLENLSVRDTSHREVGGQEGFALWIERTRKVRTINGCIYFIGNGASASMASHFAMDLAKNCRIRTDVFTDFSLITALSNDICYEQVFAEPLRWWMRQGDMLVAISSSGNSPNVVRAVETARGLRGHVLTLSAMGEDNAIRGMGNLNFYVSAQTYGLAETAHAAVLHYWLDCMEQLSSEKGEQGLRV